MRGFYATRNTTMSPPSGYYTYFVIQEKRSSD